MRDLEAVKQAHFYYSRVPYKQTWRMKNKIIEGLDSVEIET
jgi:hypothetical protein